MNPLFLLSGIGMMLVAIAAIAYWKVRSKILWRLFLWGAAAWIVGVSLKSITALLTPTAIRSLSETLPKYVSEPALWIYIGLLTGIFECGATLGFAYIKRIHTSTWEEAVGFGLGFGAVEALIVGAGAFVLVLLVTLMPDKLPPQLVKFATCGTNSLLVIPAPIVERITAVLLHAFSCLLIVYAVQTKMWKWFWVSFFYKTAVDAIAGFLHVTYGMENITTTGVWVIEAVLLPFGLVGLWGLCAFRKRWEDLIINRKQ